MASAFREIDRQPTLTGGQITIGLCSIAMANNVRYQWTSQCHQPLDGTLATLVLQDTGHFGTGRFGLSDCGSAAQPTPLPVRRAGAAADLIKCDGQQKLGSRATTAQVLALINSKGGRKQSRRSDEVRIGGLQVGLTALYNAVQEREGHQQVDIVIIDPDRHSNFFVDAAWPLPSSICMQ